MNYPVPSGQKAGSGDLTRLPYCTEPTIRGSAGEMPEEGRDSLYCCGKRIISAGRKSTGKHLLLPLS